MAARGRGEGSVYCDSTVQWKAALDLGEVGGRRVRVRRNARNKTHAAKLLRELRSGYDTTSPRSVPTVAAWMQQWLAICDTKLRHQTMIGYRQYVRLYIEPELGHLRLDRLTVEHIEALYGHMRSAGKSSGTIHTCHRRLRTALGLAVKRGIIRLNPAALAEPGRLVQADFEPLSGDEARSVLEAATGVRNGARWAVALALGLRQGEALGLMWDDIDLDMGTLLVRRSIHRAVLEHGCKRPAVCTYLDSHGASHPAKRGTDCPQRIGGGFRLDQPKTAAGTRALALSDRMVTALRAHRAAQHAERLAAGPLWKLAPHGGLVFATETGLPVYRKADWASWRDLLAAAGVSHRRVHDARHTAATLALLQGVPRERVMMMFGWSSMAMADRYQHYVDPVAKQVAASMDDALYGPAPKRLAVREQSG